MFHLNFQLTPQVGKARGSASLETAAVTQLRYDLFPGDIILRDDSCNLEAAWGWIPLLDFAAAIKRIDMELDLEPHMEAQFTFTENDESLRFSSADDEVVISATYSPCKILLPKEEFAKVVDSYVFRLRSEVEALHPELLRNASYLELFAELEKSADESS